MIACLFKFYGSAAETILELDYATGLQLYMEAVYQNNDDRLFLRWISGYQKAMSFPDFKKKLGVENDNQKPQKEESVDVIYDRVNKILEATINGNF